MIGRVEKSEAVMLAGGKGMILYENDDKGDLMSDSHWVPTVHVDNTPGLAIKSYIASTFGPTARLETGQLGTTPWAPSMTFFSSRGPTPITPDLIKPDITAPGIQILAGNTPVPAPGAPAGELFQAIAGTSMSSPHVAGIFALLKQANGANANWNAGAAKSALMTTAAQNVKDNDRVSPAGPSRTGLRSRQPREARAAPGSMFQPGLIYRTSTINHVEFLCGVDPALANALVGSSGAFC